MPRLRPSRPLSMIGTMKGIQEYKIMKSRADLAPTLAEKARIEWDWRKKDRAKDVRIKELEIKKSERSEAEAKRKLFIEMKTGFAQVASDVMAMNLSQEETTEYLNLAYQSMKDMGTEYADELEDKDGNNIIDMAEIKKEDLPKYHAAFYKELQQLAKPGDVPMTKKFGEDWVRGKQIPYKPTEPKTAIAKFIKDNPDATPEEVAEYSRSLKVPSEDKKTTTANLTADALGKWLKDESLTDKEQKLVDKYLRDSKQTTQEAYDKTRQRLKAKVDEFEALVKRKATVGEIRRMFFSDIYGILEPEEGIEEETPSTEGKPVPEKRKDESLKDYFKKLGIK